LRRAARIEALVLDVDGVLTDGTLYYGAEGEALKAFHSRDGMGMAMLRDAGIRMGVVSGRMSPLIDGRLRELGVSMVEMGRMDKGRAVEELAQEWSLPLEGLAAVGDDLVDWPMLRRVGLSAAPADADVRVRNRVHVVLSTEGGRGAVREFAEIILLGRGLWDDFGSRFQLQESSSRERDD
jgi:3-deoxy-D-manno-octulosonate 8-phosphate phosphatase (KDO 8-P phosphatase)